MKNIYLVGLLFVFIGCQEANEVSNTSADNVKVDNVESNTKDDAVKDFSGYSEALQLILKDEEQMFRGINFKFNKEEVRGTEKAKHSETADNYIIYTLDTLLSFDHEIEYQFDTTSNILNKVSFVGYFKEEGARDELYNEFEEYYNSLLGLNPKNEADKLIWETKKEYQITIEKAGNMKRPDFLLVFNKM